MAQQQSEPPFYEYDPEKRRLSVGYERKKLALEVISSFALPVAFSTIFMLSTSVNLRSYLSGITGSYWLTLIGVVVLFILAAHLVGSPIEYYSGYVIDHQFGLSKQKFRDWFSDEMKSLGLEAGFLVVLSLVLYYLIMSMELWWLAASGLLAVFSIFLSIIVPYLIMPIFYKMTPLADQNLRNELLEMSKKAGARNVDRVLVADESRRSVRANAMFSGIGSTKAIVLFDTLLQGFNKREIKTVVAHELGHYVNKDIWLSALITGVMAIPPFLAADFALNWAVANLGLKGVSDPAGFPIIFGALLGVGFVIEPLSNGLSRIIEGRADEFALRVAEDPEAQASSEKRLADMSLAVDKPHPAVEFFFYTHPPSSKRILLAEEWKRVSDSRKVR